MASSSSSSHSIPAYVSQSWKHEVFLSFRGEDTRKGFVDHLYEALVQRGIQTYKDDETLPRGATIGPALQKAIQESRIAVIVFSENYADSSWCLDELAHIVECMEKTGQIVMPVFYDVDPSEVRNQNGKYVEAFDKYEREKNKHKIDSWREALKKAGDLSGWVLKDFANGHEAQCIKKIIATISSRLPPLNTNVNKNLIGLETRLQDLKSKLAIGSGGVRMVGIWGVGGGGKTTLASATYMEISRHFEACCFLENIRDESSKNGLTKLQEKFLSLVTKTNEVIGSEIEGINTIKGKLGHKSVLVVLDDVNERKQLEALAGSHDWFGEGSRIIITTRDEHLLTRQADMIYEVTLLSHEDAINLFRKHAYRKDKPVEDYEKLSHDVVSYAGGLPLALEIIGSFLYDKDEDEWRSVLAKLKHIPYLEVTKRLKISYDGLEPDEKQLFLDIACFHMRVKIDEAMMVLDTCNFQPHVGIKVLAQKSLIKVSDGRFDMHDLVEEMAHYIVRGEHPNNPKKHSRIWNGEDIANLCDMGAAAPSMETEVLALRYHPPEFTTWLYLQRKKMSFWFPIPGYDNFQHLSNVIANMKKLRWIDWYKYPASSFPSNFQPTRLGCLMLESSQLKQLWKGYKRLPCLKILDLRCSKELMRTPDFRGLPALERLNLEKCVQLNEIHPSIGYHERLFWLNMKECSKLESFPPIIQMIKLETLVLSGCCRLKKFPEIQTSMDSLVNLHLDGTGIELVPPLVRTVGSPIPRLKFLDLSHCKSLVELSGLPSSIEILMADHCVSLQRVGDLSNCKWLWKVSLWNSYNLIGGERVMHSMLQRAEDRLMSIVLRRLHGSDFWGKSRMITLQLPHNWYYDFSGFLLYADDCSQRVCSIYIMKGMPSTNSQPDQWKEYNKNQGSYDDCGVVGYVPFGSLRHTSWWNPTYTHITFQFYEFSNPKVGLVPRKSISRGTPECWEETRRIKTFQIIDNPKSTEIKILWSHEIDLYRLIE